MTTVTELKDATGDQEEEQATGRRRGKKVLVLILALVVVAAATWWFLLRPSGPSDPKPGAILPLESTQINLADGHYLKIGIALQLVEGAGEVGRHHRPVQRPRRHRRLPRTDPHGPQAPAQHPAEGTVRRRRDGGVLHRIRDSVADRRA